MASYETIIYEKAGHTAVITLNRADRLNAFNQRMQDELTELWRNIAEDDEVWSIVLTANGRGFCSGADLTGSQGEARPKWKQTGPAHYDPGHFLSPKGQRLYKPFIVAVNGVCAGGGFYFLLEADIIICSTEASFTEPHTTHGLTAAVEMIGLRWRLPVGWVLRMALMGRHERIDAEAALKIGLVTEVVEPDRLRDRAIQIADTVNRNAPIANLATVETMWRSMNMPRDAALDFGYSMALYHNNMSEDNAEGVRAFLDKREPRWKNR